MGEMGIGGFKEVEMDGRGGNDARPSQQRARSRRVTEGAMGSAEA